MCVIMIARSSGGKVAVGGVANLSMTTYSPPMHRVVLIAFPGVQTLDVAGPAEVFSGASRLRAKPSYTVVLASSSGGVVRTTCGFDIQTGRLERVRPRPDDTVLVGGGEEGGVGAATRDPKLRRGVCRAAPIVGPMGSGGPGAVVLARGG